MVLLIEAREWDTKSELTAHLVETQRPSILLGSASEAPRKFYSFTVSHGEELYEIGVSASGLGIAPSAILLEDKKVVVCFDTIVKWVDLLEMALTGCRRLDGAFFEFLPIKSNTEVLIVHELGICRVDSRGNFLWKLQTDILEYANVYSDDEIAVKLLDCNSIFHISSVDGAIITKSA